MSESVDPDSRGRPLGRWKDRLKEYMCERGASRVLVGEEGHLEDGRMG